MAEQSQLPHIAISQHRPTARDNIECAAFNWAAPSAWIFGTAFILLGYTHPILLFRGLLGMGDTAGAIIATLVLVLALIAGARLLVLHAARQTGAAISLAVFGSFIVGNLYSVGTKLSWLVSLVPPFLLSYFALRLIPKPGFLRYFSLLLVIGICINALAMFLAPVVIETADESLATLNDSSFGTFGGRRSGLLAVPGYAAFVAVEGLAVCLTCLIEDRRWYWAIGAIASTALGVATGNRSFLLGAGAICLLIPIVSFRSFGRVVTGTLLVAVMLTVVAMIWGKTEYGEFMSERFEAGALDDAVDTRTTGTAGSLPSLQAVLKEPLFGATVVGPDGGLWVYNGENYFQPHMGWVALAATQGIPAALYLLVWHVLGLWGLLGHRGRERQVLGTQLSSGWMLAFIGGQVVSLSDVMLLQIPMFFAAALGTFLLGANRPNNASFGGQVEGLAGSRIGNSKELMLTPVTLRSRIGSSRDGDQRSVQ